MHGSSHRQDQAMSLSLHDAETHDRCRVGR